MLHMSSAAIDALTRTYLFKFYFITMSIGHLSSQNQYLPARECGCVSRYKSYSIVIRQKFNDQRLEERSDIRMANDLHVDIKALITSKLNLSTSLFTTPIKSSVKCVYSKYTKQAFLPSSAIISYISAAVAYTSTFDLFLLWFKKCSSVSNVYIVFSRASLITAFAASVFVTMGAFKIVVTSSWRCFSEKLVVCVSV